MNDKFRFSLLVLLLTGVMPGMPEPGSVQRHSVQRAVYHFRRPDVHGALVLWQQGLPNAEYRPPGGAGYTVYPNVLPGHLLRSLPGFLHVRLLSSCDRGVGVQEPEAEYR